MGTLDTWFDIARRGGRTYGEGFSYRLFPVNYTREGTHGLL